MRGLAGLREGFELGRRGRKEGGGLLVDQGRVDILALGLEIPRTIARRRQVALQTENGLEGGSPPARAPALRIRGNC
eukprot:8845619-Alexandrium_andersonii.AAC.1